MSDNLDWDEIRKYIKKNPENLETVQGFIEQVFDKFLVPSEELSKVEKLVKKYHPRLLEY